MAKGDGNLPPYYTTRTEYAPLLRWRNCTQRIQTDDLNSEMLALLFSDACIYSDSSICKNKRKFEGLRLSGVAESTPQISLTGEGPGSTPGWAKPLCSWTSPLAGYFAIFVVWRLLGHRQNSCYLDNELQQQSEYLWINTVSLKTPFILNDIPQGTYIYDHAIRGRVVCVLAYVDQFGQ